MTAAGDAFVLVEGGLVQNYPTLPVFDLDVLECIVEDEQTREEVADLAARMRETAPAELRFAIERCERWLARYDGAGDDHGPGCDGPLNCTCEPGGLHDVPQVTT